MLIWKMPYQTIFSFQKYLRGNNMFKKIPNIIVYQNEPLYKYSTFRIGGTAEYLVVVQNEDSLIEVIDKCIQTNKKI